MRVNPITASIEPKSEGNRARIQGGPYDCPLAFLPATSNFPTMTSQYASPDSTLAGALATALAAASQATREIHTNLTHQIQRPADLERELNQLCDMISGVYQRVSPDYKRMARAHTRKTGAQALRNTCIRPVGERLEDYLLQDAFFGIIRVPMMSGREFTGQIIATMRNVLTDMAYSTVDINEQISIIGACTAMFAFLAQELYPSIGAMQEGKMSIADDQQTRLTPPCSNARVWSSSWIKAWEGNVNKDGNWTDRVSRYRWIVGHHFFDISAVFCRACLLRASEALDDERTADCTEAIQLSTVFQRALTGALCYASNFPTKTYQQVIRPSMVRMGAMAGFSGVQNSDYNQMKEAKDRLKKSLNGRHDWLRSEKGAAVYEAVQLFREVYVENMEQHILIAGSKVGIDMSLAQKAGQTGLPAGLRTKSATDVLRELGDVRRHEFTL